jgi:CTP synthase (UTP-ammonia lyase)
MMRTCGNRYRRHDGDCAANLFAGGKTDAIELRNNTLIAKAYGKPEIEEGYHCNYGVSPEFAQELESGDMRVTGWDEQGEIRAAELVTHPFFVITLFQHERAALEGRPVVLAQAMLRAARG